MPFIAGTPSQQMTEHTGTSSQPPPLTSQGTPDPSSGKPEALDTGVLASSLYPESEDTSESFSEEEDTGESRPAHLGPAKGETGKGLDTAASINVKLRWVYPPHGSKDDISLGRLPSRFRFNLVPIDTIVS